MRLAKTYDPKNFEEPIYQKWEQSGAFKTKETGEAWTMMMPPPNVTGRLHMGHALNMTLQDIMARYWRQKGRAVLWQAGTDHAGIATQAVVERALAKQDAPTRQELGRGAFEKKIWEWKETYGGAIVVQLKRLGASTDWDSGRFTLDEGMSHAVRYAFVNMHKAGLIYRAQRLVNWDVKLKTAISDLEVVQKEQAGHLWHLRYPVEGSTSGEVIVVATTRPETMLGDCAVAVHPNDERYRDLIGKSVRVPLVNRVVPIVADTYVDPDQGSGAVKITPAHDFNDFEVGTRHNLMPINILDEAGALLQDEIIPPAYRGLAREVARKKIVADLETQDGIEKIEDMQHSVPYGDRSDEVIEPYLTWQWFLDAEKLAPPAIGAVRKGDTKFIPDYWNKTYFEWMENIQPWCISRQLWWGHRIPAWFDAEGKIIVAMTEAEAQAQAGDKKLRQDEDVLDTWFSSGLWAFSTLGWQNGDGDKGDTTTPNALLERHFPTDLLITGLDIIFFWVARMMMLSCYFMDKPPFKEIYIHALVRDAKGQKMTKSKGNVVDPLLLMDKFGADALRFTMAAQAIQGQDLKLSEARIQGYRNFATKLWNAARFCEMNEVVFDKDFTASGVTDSINQWILHKLATTQTDIEKNIKTYQFNIIADKIYHFVWGDFCDWYLELAKVNLGKAATKEETQKTLAFVLHHTLIMLHPFMPFITEELWQGAGFLMNHIAPKELESEQKKCGAIEELIEVIGNLRKWREELDVKPSASIKVFCEDKARSTLLTTYQEHLFKLARTSFEDGKPPATALHITIADRTLFLDLGDKIDKASEQKKFTEEMKKTLSEIKKIESKLNNVDFVTKAPAQVVEENRARLATYQQTQDGLEKMLKILSA